MALTLASLFTGGLKVTAGVDLRLSYIFVGISFFSFIFIFQNPKIIIFPILVILSYMILCFLIVLIQDSSILLTRTIPQIIGISFFAFFFILFFSNAQIAPSDLFLAYVRLAAVVALLGFPILLYSGVTEGFWRLKSIFAEPAHYSIAMMPATSYAIIKAKSNLGRFLLFFTAIVLTFSLTAYIGLGLTLAFAVGRNWYTRIAMAFFATLLLIGAYASSSEIRMRIDDTSRVASTTDFSNVNLSTYALLSNLWVAWKSLQENPIFGSGLGSHPINHERYIGQLKGLGSLEEYIDQNKFDANSLFIRIVSEQGFFGFCLFIIFIISFHKSWNQEYQIINNSILIYFILKLIREGHYFTPEFFFMIFIYIFNSSRYRRYAAT